MDLALSLFIGALLCLMFSFFGLGKSKTKPTSSFDEAWEEAQQEVEAGLYDEEFDELLESLDEEDDYLDIDEEELEDEEDTY